MQYVALRPPFYFHTLVLTWLRRSLPGGLPFRPGLDEEIVFSGFVHAKVLVQKQNVEKGLGPLSLGLCVRFPQEPTLEVGKANDKIPNGRARNGNIQRPPNRQKEELGELHRHVLEDEIDPVGPLRGDRQLDPELGNGLWGFDAGFLVDVGRELDDVGDSSRTGIDDIGRLGVPPGAVFGKTGIGGRRKEEVPGAIERRGFHGRIEIKISESLRGFRGGIDLGELRDGVKDGIGRGSDAFRHGVKVELDRGPGFLVDLPALDAKVDIDLSVLFLEAFQCGDLFQELRLEQRCACFSGVSFRAARKQRRRC